MAPPVGRVDGYMGASLARRRQAAARPAGSRRAAQRKQVQRYGVLPNWKTYSMAQPGLVSAFAAGVCLAPCHMAASVPLARTSRARPLPARVVNGWPRRRRSQRLIGQSGRESAGAEHVCVCGGRDLGPSERPRLEPALAQVPTIYEHRMRSDKATHAAPVQPGALTVRSLHADASYFVFLLPAF
jgi:hypothetical protein